MRLLEDARQGEFDVVIVNEFGRLSRRQVEQAVIIDLLERAGVKIESVTEKFEDSPIGHFMRAVYAFMAEIEREKIMERTDRGRRKKAREGNLLGQGAAKYGYKWTDKRTAYLYNDEVIHVETDDTAWTEASVVTWIFNQLHQRVSQRRIALTLNEKGVPTRKGGAWLQSTIKVIAKDPQYTGDARALRYKCENGKDGWRPVEEQIILPAGTIPPLVSHEQFKEVQAILKDNKAFSERNNGDPSSSLFRGLCKCGTCNYTMHVQRHITYDASRGDQYRCVRKTGIVGDSHTVTILVSEVDEKGWEVAMEHIKDPSLMRISVDKLLADLKSDNETQDVLAKQFEDLKRQFRNLWVMAENCTDNDSLATLTARLNQLETEKRQLEGLQREIDDEEELKEKLEKELTKFVEWADKVRPLLSDPSYIPTYQEKRLAVLILGIRAKVFPDKGYPYQVKINVPPPT